MQDQMPNTESHENNNNSIPPNQPQQFNPYAQPLYYPVYTAKPKPPGRGFGIASMILGIFGVVYSFFICIVSFAIKYNIPLDSDTGNGVSTYGEANSIVGMGFVSLVCAILACIFAVVSRKKGYRKGLSISGFVLSIVSFVLIAACALFNVSANSDLFSKQHSPNDIKQKIVGEWDCEVTGYLVILDDNTYRFYKDSSKDTGNVVSGTYEATNGILTNAAGYAEGITFIATIKGFIVDGEEQRASEGSKIQYAFSPDGTGNYNGRNLNTDSYFKMTKIK